MGSKHAGKRGPLAFERYYGDLFGQRWTAMRSALLADPAHVRLGNGLMQPYYLDAASLLVALALDAQPGHTSLDLCAAPGGKTLVAALTMRGRGVLVANERSATRRNRLHRVIAEHLPEQEESIVRITGHDAARWGLYEPDSYDRILADVPCSSERHVIRSGADLEKWSASRTRRLSQNAYAIACAAIDSLKPGGRLVYSTCALSDKENDHVIERLLSRSTGSNPSRPAIVSDSVSVAAIVAASALEETRLLQELTIERSRFGNYLLPDRNNGAGPMYFAVLTK